MTKNKDQLEPNEQAMETITILAGLIRRAKMYDTMYTKELAVPVTTIAEVLEQFTSTQTNPTNTLESDKGDV